MTLILDKNSIDFLEVYEAKTHCLRGRCTSGKYRLKMVSLARFTPYRSHSTRSFLFCVILKSKAHY